MIHPADKIEWKAYYSPRDPVPNYRGTTRLGMTCPYCGLQVDSMAYYHPCAGTLAAKLFQRPAEIKTD